MTTLEHLECAVGLLVSGHDALAVRLNLAYHQHLHRIGAGDIPAELSPRFKSILDRFGPGDIDVQLAALSPKAASKLALDIFKLSCALSQGLYH